MKLISITYTPDTGKVSYSFTSDNEVRTYFADVYDNGGIRGVVCEPDLETLLLEAQTRKCDAVKTLSKATWDFIDGVGVIFPIVL